MIVVFWRPGRLRVEEDGPCLACQWEDEYDRQMGWTVQRYVVDEYPEYIKKEREK